VRIRLLGSAAITALLLPLAAAAYSPASAATAQRRYVVLAGDDDFLVYATAVRSHPLNPFNLPATAEVYALGRSGPPIHIGKALPEPRIVSLSRSNLVIVNPFKHHKRVRSWNLKTGAHDAIGTNEGVVGASPHGWIAEDPGYVDGTHVVERPASGGIVDYGNPVTPGVDFAVTVGPDGFVAYADNFLNDNGEITYTRWSRPQHHVTLREPGDKNVRCDSVSSSYAACLQGSAAKRFLTLYAVDGQTSTTGGGSCAYELTVFGTELAYTINTTRRDCKIGHLGLLTNTGATRTSSARFDPLSLTVAWDKLVTSSRGQRELVTLAGINATGKSLRRANVS
jgi:hypothetical protein